MQFVIFNKIDCVFLLTLSSAFNELLQSDNTIALASGFVRSTAMDKLHVWKANIPRTLEITESEIDSLENNLKLLTPDVGGSCNRVEDFDRESLGTATSKFVESVVLCNSSMNSQTVVLRDSSVNLDIIPEKAECSQDHGGDNMLGVATGNSYTVLAVTPASDFVKTKASSALVSPFCARKVILNKAFSEEEKKVIE
ncbi:hypothetical protein Tco_0714189 [Tanacetum coccineum]